MRSSLGRRIALQKRCGQISTDWACQYGCGVMAARLLWEQDGGSSSLFARTNTGFVQAAGRAPLERLIQVQVLDPAPTFSVQESFNGRTRAFGARDLGSSPSFCANLNNRIPFSQGLV